MRCSTKQYLLGCVSFLAILAAGTAHAASVAVSGSTYTSPITLGAGETLTYTTPNSVMVNNSAGAVVTINGSWASIDTTGAAYPAITTTGTLGGPVIDVVAGGTNATITNPTKTITETDGANQPVIQINAAGATVYNGNGATIAAVSTAPVINLLGGATGFHINNDFGNIINSDTGTAITLANGASGTIDSTQGTIVGAIDNSANASSITINLQGNFNSVSTGDIKFGSGSDIINSANGSTIGTIYGGIGNKGTVNITSGATTATEVGAGHAVAALNISDTSGLTTTGSVNATAISIDGNGTLDSGGDVTGPVTFSAYGTLSMTGNSTTLANNVSTTGGGTSYGTVAVYGQDVLLAGNLGNSTTERLGVLNILNTGTTTAAGIVNGTNLIFSNDGTVVFSNASGDSYIAVVQAVNPGHTGTINITNTSGVNTFGTIGNSVEALSALNITGNGGTTLINGNVFANNINIGSGSTLRPGASGNVYRSNLSNNGTLALGTNALTVWGNISGTNSIITTTIGATSAGHIDNVNNTANATFLTGLSVIPTISNGVSIANNNKVVLIHGNAGQAIVDPSSIATVVSSPFLHWALSAGTTGTDMYGNAFAAQDIVMTASRVSASTIPGVNQISGSSLDGLNNYSGSDTNVLALLSTAQNLSTAPSINQAGAQLAPQTNEGYRSSTLEAVRTAMTTLAARNDNMRMAQAEQKGLSSGEAFNGGGYWAQGFGSLVAAGVRNGVNGYDSTTGGVAFGVDQRVLDDVRLGALFAYANTRVDETGDRTGSGLKINSYIGTIYGTYTGNPWYIDANATFGYHDYDSKRLINFAGASSQTAVGSFAGQQYGVSAEFGYPLEVNEAIVTPYASLTYDFLHQDSYTETGAPAANQTVNDRNSSSVRSGLGAKIATTLGSKDDWTFTPSARAAWMHEFNGNAPSMTSSYAGGSSYTTPGLKLATEAGVLGVGLEAKDITGLTFSAKYDAELRDQYVGHNLMLQLRQEF